MTKNANCPYGVPSKNFNSKEETMNKQHENNEKEFGLIPTEDNQAVNKGPWPLGNPNEWESTSAYSYEGVKDEEIFVRPAADDKNKIEFFARVASVDGSSHIISKGTVDLKDKKVKKTEVEKFYGVKQKEDPVRFMQNVISYYGGDNFDNDPIYLNARRSENIAKDIEKVYKDYGIPTSED